MMIFVSKEAQTVKNLLNRKSPIIGISTINLSITSTSAIYITILIYGKVKIGPDLR